MVKHIYPLLIFFSFTLNLISQEAKISTKFSQDGNLYQTSTKTSQTIAEFKENEKCIVTSYIGNYTYKIKYKDLVGFVKDQYLFVNEQMMDLYFDHEEKERNKAIQERKRKQEKAVAVIVQASEDKELMEQKYIDSTTKIDSKEEPKKERIVQVKKDSSNQVIKEQNKVLADKRSNESIAKAEDAAQKQLANERQNGSITQAKENQKKALEKLRKRNDSVVKVKAQQKIEAERKKNDSLTKVKEDKKKDLEVLRKRNDSVAKVKEQQKTEAKRKKNDSLTKVKEDKKKALKELKKRNYSVAKAKAQEKALEEKRKKNTINQTKEEQSKRIIEKRRYDSIVKVNELETKQLIELRRQNDSIARIIENERKELEALRNRTALAKETHTSISNSKKEENKKATLLERIKFRDSCHYQINEYDRFYNITTIRTEPYTLNKNLTVELYKQGRKTDVFFNLSEDLGCATYLPNQRSSVKITLENNRIVNFYHSWDIECGELFLFKARLSSININILKKSPIKSIVIHGTQGYKEINFIEYKEFFIDKLKCIE